MSRQAEEKAVTEKKLSDIQRQLNRLEKVSMQFSELNGRMREDLAMVLVSRPQPSAPPRGPGNPDGSELGNILDVIADRLEAALDSCIHTLNEVDL